MIKTVIAAVVAAAFLTAVPVRAEDKAGAPAAEKAEKTEKAKKEKSEKKDDKGAKKDDKAGW
jgi:ribosomal protein L12E/L44/L45/RPP1/RPP2